MIEATPGGIEQSSLIYRDCWIARLFGGAFFISSPFPPVGRRR